MKTWKTPLLVGALAVAAAGSVGDADADIPAGNSASGASTENVPSSYNLQLVGELNLGAYTREVRVTQNTAVVGVENRVAIVDVSDPAMPLLRGSVSSALRDAAFGIRLANRLAYIAEASTKARPFDTGYLEIVDFAIPEQPRIAGALPLGSGALAIAVSDQKAYVVRRRWPDAVTLAGRLEIIDVADPTRPALIAGVDLPGDPTSVLLDGNLAYVAQEIYSYDARKWVGGHLSVVDVADDRAPFSAGELAFEKALWGMDKFEDHLVVGGNIWLNGDPESEITFLDLSQQTHPQLLHSLDWNTFVGPIRFNGALMWLSEQLDGKLSVLDPESENLTRLASCSVGSGSLIYFDVQGSRAYAANYARGLQIFQLTEPPPVADASATSSLVISPNGTNATVILDGSLSFAPSGSPLDYSWFFISNSEPPPLLAREEVAVVDLPVGEHTIALVVYDGMTASTNEIAVAVLTSAQGTARIIALVAESDLAHPRSLLATLEAASESVERGHGIAAANQLRAFQRKVWAQVMPVSPVAANTLLQAAQQVIDALDPSAG